MVFDYYHRLSARAQRIYRASDAIASIALPNAQQLAPLIAQIESALAAEQQRLLSTLCQKLSDGICYGLEVPFVRVQVLAARPNNRWGELHGLYTPPDDGKRATIQVWMRTAKHKRVVAFKSFLRTLLHELCHHLDYELLRLPETFHTAGFYSRESSLFHQLVPGAAGKLDAAPAEPPAAKDP